MAEAPAAAPARGGGPPSREAFAPRSRAADAREGDLRPSKVPGPLGRIAGLALEVAAYLVGRRLRLRVVGPSMAPSLLEGDHLLARRVTLQPSECIGFLVGHLVAARHPTRSSLVVVKRVARAAEGLVWLSSDNPCGTDSRHFGPVSCSDIIAIATACIGDGGRSRRLR